MFVTLLRLVAIATLGVAPLTISLPEASASQGCERRTVVGVAHQDDDLLFMNPDLQHEIDAGSCVSVVYLTAGDAGHKDDYYVESREDGVREAYAKLTRAPNRWWRADLYSPGHRLRSFTLSTSAGREGVRLVFMRLPDGFPKGQESSSQNNASLLKLFRGELTEIHAVDQSASYSEAQLLETLRWLRAKFRPNVLRTLDYDNIDFNGSVASITAPADHSDHSVAARYFRTAFAGHRISIYSYLGYRIGGWPSNVAPLDEQRKSEAFRAYVRHEGCHPADCPPPPDRVVSSSYALYISRQYLRDAPRPAPGELLSAIGSTSAVSGDNRTSLCLGIANGAPVSTRCGNGPSSQWRFTDGRLRSLGVADRCLITVGETLALAPCASDGTSSWRLIRDGQIRYGARCLTQDDLLRPRPLLHLQRCKHGSIEQRWHLGDGIGRS
ncbi:MAG TPA: PIG-L family deacetylase [Mycobacteriales bacterium]|nr:PIG-L family deacetylase [Mycobacteriales bacterium]